MLALADSSRPATTRLKSPVYSLPDSSPGLLSILITVLRHNMAAIAEIGGFCIHFTLFVFCSELVGLSTRGVTIHVPFDSIRFRLLPFGFDYFDSIMQNINDF